LALDRWNPRKQLLLETEARLSPINFVTHPYFLGRNPYPMQAQIFSDFYSSPYHMLLVGICGMRGGKTRLAADILCYEIFDLLTTANVERKYGLEDDSKFFLTCVASSSEQAEDTIFWEVKKSIGKAPFFQKFDPGLFSTEVRFDDQRIEVKAGVSSAMGLVGRTVKCNVFDELSKLEKTEGKRSAELVYSSLSKSTSSFQFAGKNIVITSPMYTEDKAWQLYEENLGSKYACCYNLPTWDMNPNLPFEGEYMQARLAEDPITFWRDFGAKPQSADDKFFRDEDIIDEVFNNQMINIFSADAYYDQFRDQQWRNPVQLVCAGDPSGRLDSFGLALMYKETDMVTGIDHYYAPGVTRYEPKSIERSQDRFSRLKPVMEIDPIEIYEDLIGIRENLNCRYFVFDTWNYPMLQKELELRGCEVLNNIVKTEHYEAVRKLMYAGTLHVPYHEVLDREWKQLIQKSTHRVDHPKTGSKDIADCISNAVYILDQMERQVRAPLLVRRF
jgi:hypothetical protein